MKKFLITFFVLVAIAGFGGNSAVTHADTMTPAQAAALQQTLDSLKAKLLDLQAQANAQAQSGTISGMPLTLQGSAALSSSDVAALRSGLSMLAAALTNLRMTIAANPQLTAGREQVVLSALKGIGTTLASIGTTLGNQSIAPVAIAAPQQAPASGPVAQSAPAVPSTNGAAPSGSSETAPLLSAGTQPSGSAVPSNAAPQTAQAGSSWSLANLNWPLVIVIVLVVLAVGLWLFWPADDGGGNVSKKARKAAPVMPQKPITSSVKPVIAAPTPLSSAMAAPMEKPQVPAPTQPPMQQRNPA